VNGRPALWRGRPDVPVFAKVCAVPAVVSVPWLAVTANDAGFTAKLSTEQPRAPVSTSVTRMRASRRPASRKVAVSRAKPAANATAPRLCTADQLLPQP
jgi:hypothetical protein